MGEEVWKLKVLSESLTVNFKDEIRVIQAFQEKDEYLREILFFQARINIENDESHWCNKIDDVKVDQRKRVNAEIYSQTRKWEWNVASQKNQAQSVEVI